MRTCCFTPKTIGQHLSINTQYGSLSETWQSQCETVYYPSPKYRWSIHSFNLLELCGFYTGHQFILHIHTVVKKNLHGCRPATPDGFLYSFQPNKKFALGILQNWSRGLIKRPVMRAIGHSHEHGRHLSSSSRHTAQESIAINISSVLCVFVWLWVRVGGWVPSSACLTRGMRHVIHRLADMCTRTAVSKSRDLLAAALRFSPYLIGYPKKSLSHNLLPLITLFCLSWSNILTPLNISFVLFFSSAAQRSELGSHYSAQHILYSIHVSVCVCIDSSSTADC